MMGFPKSDAKYLSKFKEVKSMLKRFSKKSAKLTAAVTLGLCLAAAPSCFALNEAGGANNTGSKAFNLNGYQFVDGGANADTLYLYFDKDVSSPGEINEAMFVVTPYDDPTNPISHASTYSVLTNGNYSGTSDTTLKGTRVAIPITLDRDTLYDVYMNGSFMNKNGITLGNYNNRKDLKFTFKTPDSNGAYTGNPYITYLVGDGTSNISRESNMVVVFDRPYYASGASSFLTSMDSGFLNTTPTPDVAVSANGECYDPIFNDANSSYYGTDNGRNTTVFFQETKSGSATTIYNRASGSNSYQLTVPTDFYDVNNRHTTSYHDDVSNVFTFSTASSNYPGWEMNNSSVSGANGNITVTHDTANDKLVVSWYDTWANEDPAEYEIWYRNAGTLDQYAPLANWTYVDDASGTGTSEGQQITFEITNTVAHPVLDGSTYWVRVVPKNSSNITAGFSKSNASAI